MNNKIIFLVLSPIYFSVYLNAEQSVFGAGNLDSSSPYGLSQSEKKY